MRSLDCLLRSSTWGTKVSDFGLSREKSVDETMSVTGTPLWLPPEMIRGERYTEKADVYSFGIGALHMLLMNIGTGWVTYSLDALNASVG